MSLNVDEVREVVADVLDMDPAALDVEADRDAVPGWDSLAHLRVVTALEDRFGMRLTMEQISQIRTVVGLAQASGAA